MSRLVLACDHRDTLAEGAAAWDARWEARGRTFDAGFVDGAVRHEVVPGEWLGLRRVAGEATAVVKGAHFPCWLPGAIEPQMDLSLSRLELALAPICVMHRDNPDVPVGEFVDVSGDLGGPRAAGQGGRPGRLQLDASAAARGDRLRRGEEPGPLPRIFNLSLAMMEPPV